MAGDSDLAARRRRPGGRNLDSQPTPGDEIRILVERAQRGDIAAIGELYDVFAPRVFRYLRFRVDGPETAEDLMQRVFVKMIEQLPAYRPSGAPFAAWLFRVARNAWIDQRRTSHATVSLDDLRAEHATDADLEDLSAAAFDAAAIRSAVASLPADQREVIACRFFADLTPRETAAVLGRSEGSVRVLQHRALGRLKRTLPSRDALTVAGLTATEQ